MPHSKTGRKVSVGDKVVTVTRYGDGEAYATGGTIVSITEAETCNAQVVPFGSPTQFVTLKDCVHVDDLADFKPEPSKG